MPIGFAGSAGFLVMAVRSRSGNSCRRWFYPPVRGKAPDTAAISAAIEWPGTTGAVTWGVGTTAAPVNLDGGKEAPVTSTSADRFGLVEHGGVLVKVSSVMLVPAI